MGKIRVAALGDEQQEKDQKKKADARRAQKALDKKAAHAEAVTDAKSAEAPSDQPKTDDGTEVKANKKPREIKAHVRSKRYKEAASLVDKTKLYPLKEAAKLVKKTSTSTFDGTVEIHINLSLQAINNKPEYRGNVILPHGTGKKINVAIADDELLKKLEAGKIEFDLLVAHPSMMAKLAKYARVLGPKGLMPNPKTGTVSTEPEKRAKELSQGEVNFKTEPGNPVLHLGIGKVSFTEDQIIENIRALILAIGKNKLAKATLTSTMGPGIKLDLTAL